MNRLFVTLRITYRLLTPAWLGNALQQPELRVPSLKGLLRFWYRALEPEFQHTPFTLSGDAALPNKLLTREDVLFGSVGEIGGKGIGQWRLETPATPLKTLYWKDLNAEQFGDGWKRPNGLKYLGYTFTLGENSRRQALAPDQRFTLCLDLTPKDLQRLLEQEKHGLRARRGLLGAVWLLGTLGSMGTRARRGFGALELEDWRLEERSAQLVPPGSILQKYLAPPDSQAEATAYLEAWREDLKKLPLTAQAKSIQEWTAMLNQGLPQLWRWLPDRRSDQDKRPSTAPRHPHLGDKFQALLAPTPARRWDECLHQLGVRFQSFRKQAARSDSDLLKNHAAFLNRQSTGIRLALSPERVVFGLPITFRTSAGEVKLLAFNPQHHGVLRGSERKELEVGPIDRHPSLLLLRPVRLQGQFYPLAVRLDGAIPGVDPGTTLPERNDRLRPPTGKLLDDFILSLRGGIR